MQNNERHWCDQIFYKEKRQAMQSWRRPITEEQFIELSAPAMPYLNKDEYESARIYWTGIMEYQI